MEDGSKDGPLEEGLVEDVLKAEEFEKEAEKYRGELVERLEEYSSVELIAQIILLEIRAQRRLFDDPDEAVRDNPFGLVLSGLFLNNHELNAELEPNARDEVTEILSMYFQTFRMGLTVRGNNAGSGPFLMGEQRLAFDANPRCFDEQKTDQIESTFAEIDEFLLSEFGFDAGDALDFAGIISGSIERRASERQELWEGKYEQIEEDYNRPQNSRLRKTIEETGSSVENEAIHLADYYYFTGAAEILTINAGEFCEQNCIERREKFAGFLEALSCTFGDQLEDFEDPLSGNILSFKPFIKLDGDSYFCTQPASLIQRLDFILENLLTDERRRQTEVWETYEQAKSEFLEGSTFDYFSRIFPAKNMYRNMSYQTGGERHKADLLVVFDNKILVVESAANHIPMAGRRGMNGLEEALKEMIMAAHLQAARTRDYIRSAGEAVFAGESGEELRIDNKNGDYRFIFINSTLEALDAFQLNLLDSLGVSGADDRPWPVNLFDLDVITDCVPSPAYFLHYVHQRARARREIVFGMMPEGVLLGYYFKHGNFYGDRYGDSSNPLLEVLDSDFFEQFREHYVSGGEKPELEIPPELSDLVRNMEKYRQKGFTDVTNILLDFPDYARQDMGKLIKASQKKIESGAHAHGFSKYMPKPYDFGFSYFVCHTMTDFYKNAKKTIVYQKYKEKITRWAMIGRNYEDKKNLATFFYYVDEPWKHDESQEGVKDSTEGWFFD